NPHSSEALDAQTTRSFLQDCEPEEITGTSPELQSLYEFRDNEDLFRKQFEELSGCKEAVHVLQSDLQALEAHQQSSRPAPSQEESPTNIPSPVNPLSL